MGLFKPDFFRSFFIGFGVTAATMVLLMVPQFSV